MSSFTDRTDYITAQTSEKLTLAHVHGRERLFIWNGPTADIFNRSVNHFVYELHQDLQKLTRVSLLASVVEGTFFYDIPNGTLHARFFNDDDPSTFDAIVTYRFFYCNGAISTTWNLENIADQVAYEPRIMSAPGYKHKIGIDQALASLVGQGDLKLQGADGGLDETFDTLIFENQPVEIYSWNQDLDPSESQIIYRGLITNKSFDEDTVTFRIKDLIFNLLENPLLDAYTNADNVSTSVEGQYKRRIYGRVDGLRSQSIDQIADGVELTGTVSATANNINITGIATLFLTEVFQGDNIAIGTQEFTVESITSDTVLVVSDETEFAFSGQTAILSPERGTILKNRDFLCAGHICARVTKTITSVKQLNRVVLNDTEGLFAGDFLEFPDTGERLEIKTVAPGNIIVLVQNMINKPTVSTDAIRRPIQEVFIEGVRVAAADFTITNDTVNGCGLIFEDDVEFNLARARNTSVSFDFTNGSRTVTVVGTPDITLQDILRPRDFIKPNDNTYNTFFKISSVSETSLELIETFVDITIQDIAEVKSPNYIEDDSIISVNILGRTVDNTAEGQWIQTSAQAERDLIDDAGITAIDEQSFTDGAVDGSQLVSMAIPQVFTSKSLPNIKSLCDDFNKSINSSLTLNNELELKFKVLNVFTEAEFRVIRDQDVIKWSIKTTNGKTFRRAIARYRFTDTNRTTLEAGNKSIDFSSDFIEKYIGTNKSTELNLFIYEDFDANISAHRNIYYNRLSVATIKLTSDLRLEDLELGEIVLLDFDRLYIRFGDTETRKKLGIVIAKSVTGEEIQYEISDLGNTFNSSSYITDNAAPDFSTSDEDDKIRNGYITDSQGIVNDEEDTANTHLIS